MAQRYLWTGVLAVGLQLLGAELGSAAAALNCQTAADCGGPPATCQLTTYQTCAGKDPACPAGSPCGEKPTMPNQPGCAPYVEGICHQAYEQPCQVDADCGTGFRCAEQIGMACSGMGSSGSPGVAPTSHEECHVSRGAFACELNRTPCTVDTDCAAGLRCQQSDASSCFKRTCKLDTGCATGLRCEQSGASFCWTSFAPPSDPDAARALDACSESPPVLCAPRGYFNAPEVNLADGGVAGFSDDTVTGSAGSAPNQPPAQVGVQAGATDAGERSASPAQSGVEAFATDAGQLSAPVGGGGCSLRASARAAHAELSWAALLGMLVFRRRRRVS